MSEDRTKQTKETKPASARAPSSSPSSESYPSFIPAHGGYENLLSYRKSQIIYDATVRFCDRFVDRRSRTHDQMVQAARSGNKNIAEGSQVSGTSKEAELKLTGVARGSLENCLVITAITSVNVIMPSGTKIPAKPSTFANSVPARMSLTSPIGPSSKPAQPKSWPTSSSV